MMHKIKQSPESLEHNIPPFPLSSLTLDNFEYKGTLYLIIYNRFSRFVVMKTPRELSARSTIMCLLEVFCEHRVPSFICTDRGRNFVSTDFSHFYQDLGIHLNFSIGYHHSANQAERAVHTVKDLIKHCYSASVHWRLALLEYLCTPGPNGKSPSELLYRQFRGNMPMLSDSSSCILDANKLTERRKEEKEKFDARHQHELKPLVIGSTVSFLNSDLKMWSMGLIHGRFTNRRSYEILTENGLIFSRTECIYMRLMLCSWNMFPLVFLLQITSVMLARILLCLQSHHQFPISLQLLILMLKLPKALLVLMTIVIEHGQAG